VTLPFVVILALVLSNAGQHPKPAAEANSGRALPPLALTPPPSDPTTQGPCTKLLTALPVQLGALVPRVVHPKPDSPFVVAWGDPAVVLRCGVARPSQLTASSSEFVLVANGVAFFQSEHHKTHVFTAIDRAAYVEVQVPNSYAQPPLGALAAAIAKALPPVCVVDPKETERSKLCTYRK